MGLVGAVVVPTFLLILILSIKSFFYLKYPGITFKGGYIEGKSFGTYYENYLCELYIDLFRVLWDVFYNVKLKDYRSCIVFIFIMISVANFTIVLVHIITLPFYQWRFESLRNMNILLDNR